MTIHRIFGTLCAVAALSLAPLHATAQTKEPLKIGVLIALSGPAAAYGAAERRAMEAVAQKTNDEGGINGRKIELIVRDTKTNPTEAARLANQVIADEHVIAIVGATTGSETLSFADAAMQARVPIFPMVGTQSVTDPAQPFSKWVFRMSPPLTTDLTASIERLVKDGKKRLAIFSEEDAYGQQGSTMAVALAKKYPGLEVVENISAPKAATDFTTQAPRCGTPSQTPSSWPQPRPVRLARFCASCSRSASMFPLMVSPASSRSRF